MGTRTGDLRAGHCGIRSEIALQHLPKPLCYFPLDKHSYIVLDYLALQK